jgi:hypothetical protein
MIPPMQATAAEQVPAMEPKMAQATIVAAPIPPRILPRMAWAKVVSRWAMPEEAMSAPAMMKKGMESSVREFRE